MRIIGKSLKIIIALMIILNCMNIFCYTVHAQSVDTMMSQAQSFIDSGEDQAKDINIEGITEAFIPLGQLLTSVGAGVMVAVTTYMGIKYITSGPDAQAKLKQQLIGVIVSGVVIFGAYGIWSIVVRIASNF